MDRHDMDCARSIAEEAVRRSQESMRKRQGELQAKVGAWVGEKGLLPADKAKALELIDELRWRGVASFEGLGIKVTFRGGTEL